MTVITKKTEYAIISLMELATLDEGETMTTRSIAERQEIPANLVTQILVILRRAGLTGSIRGAGGGIFLKKDPSTINLREVAELIDGPLSITRCTTPENHCKNKKSCDLRKVWLESQQALLKVLEQKTIKDLL